MNGKSPTQLATEALSKRIHEPLPTREQALARSAVRTVGRAYTADQEAKARRKGKKSPEGAATAAGEVVPQEEHLGEPQIGGEPMKQEGQEGTGNSEDKGGAPRNLPAEFESSVESSPFLDDSQREAILTLAREDPASMSNFESLLSKLPRDA